MDGEERVLERGPRPGDEVGEPLLRDLEDELARERVAVRLEAGRGETDEHVARADRLARDEVLPRDLADDRSADVVLAVRRVEAGHLRRLAAEEREPVAAAAAAEAGDDLGEDLGVELRGAEVVEEEERRRSLREDVVHAVVHEVLAHGVVDAGHVRDLELRADAVRGGDEDLVLPGRAEEAAEAADVGENAGRLGALDVGLDSGEAAVHLVDVDAGGGIGGLLLLLHGFARNDARAAERAARAMRGRRLGPTRGGRGTRFRSR